MASVKQAWIKKYGEKEGLKRWEDHCESRKGIGTLKWYIERYGKDGTKKYKENVDKKRKASTLDGYVERYGKTEGPIKYKEKNSRLSISEKALEKNNYAFNAKYAIWWACY